MTSSPHPTTLVLGDIHHQTERVDQVIEAYVAEHYGQIVFLGDYFDSFGDNPERMRATCRWLRASMEQSNRVHLLGNHDLAYLVPRHSHYRCPGHTPEKQHVFDEEMAGIDSMRLRVALSIGSWLLSHAGFTAEQFLGASIVEMVEHAHTELQQVLDGQDRWLLQIGRSRGGDAAKGGPLWLDWPREFKPVAGVNQIVGHSPATGVLRGKCVNAAGVHRQYEFYHDSPPSQLFGLPQPGPEWVSVNWCLDTRQAFVGSIVGDQFEATVVRPSQ